MSLKRSTAHISTMVLIVGSLLGSTLPSAHAVRAPAPAAVHKTKNLIKNPGAESGDGSSDGSTVTVPKWHRNAGVTQVKYGAAGGFPDAHTPGPSGRGHNFFAGGNTGDDQASVSQIISLSAYKTAIAGGHVTFALTAWLGGFANDPDNAQVSLSFEKANSVLVGSVTTIGPVSNTQRNNQTMFLSRSATGPVPKTAAFVYISIIMTRVSGGPYNDGYADNLSVVLSGV